MNLFADYVQPLTDWLQANPHWSLFITFAIALTESLAIIGSIIPGSVTMTAIGILAGSGIMRLDFTLIAASLGAVCGDSLSYALGYFYSERLVEIWPFRKHPKLLSYGKDFFARHGGKSVLIGRFVGPLRSLIPVIAGIMHMKQWRFLLANILSAVGWALLYIMPGALIGAASHELSSESSTRLFLLVLALLVGIWLTSLLIKWLFFILNSYLNNNLHHFWLYIKSKPLLSSFWKKITPARETNHYPTAALALLISFSLLFFIVLSIGIKTKTLNFIDVPVHLFLQSFHTPLLEAFFIICTQLTSTLTLISLYIILGLWTIYYKHYKTLCYITSLLIFSAISALLLAYGIYSPRPQDLKVIRLGSSFPVVNLQIATAFYGFILFYINDKPSLLINAFKTFTLITLGLSGLGILYLGDVWFSDVIASYFIGLIIGLIHYLIYRKSNRNYLKIKQSLLFVLLMFSTILSTAAYSTYLNFKTLMHNHALYRKEYSLEKSIWWNQQKPLLPLYRLSRIGHKISLLNIQYVGDLDLLQTNLEQEGWELHTESFFTKLLMRLNSNSKVKLPLLAQLYENEPPELTMTYKDKLSQLILELNIWESNYRIAESNQPLWIGAIHQNTKADKTAPLINPLTYLIPALSPFTLRRIELPKDKIHPTLFLTAPTILLIQN